MADWNIKNILSYLPIALVVAALIYLNVHKETLTMVVENRNTTTDMFFDGIVTPKDTYNVISPVEGTVVNSYHAYGQTVKKGDLLYAIHSKKLDETFHQVVEEYIKAKAEYKNFVFQSAGITELYELGLESKVSYLSQMSQMQNSQLALFHAEQKLKDILAQTGDTDIKLEDITFEKAAQIYKILARPSNNLKVYSPVDGTLFFPSSTVGTGATGNSEKQKEGQGKIFNGSSVTEGQVLAVIGNMTSLFLDFKVSEVKFNDLKVGQPATINSASFRGITLKGYVSSIDKQANTSQYTGIQTYQATIVVPDLTMIERRHIQVGMSAEITITKKNPPMIVIPIDAVFKKSGEYWVKVVVDKENRTIKEIPVSIGSTDQDSVQILYGLSPGDEIVLSN